jgi:hypothetical protein
VKRLKLFTGFTIYRVKPVGFYAPRLPDGPNDNAANGDFPFQPEKGLQYTSQRL